MTLDQLVQTLHEGDYTLVLQDKEGRLHTFTNRGVRDLYQLLTTTPETLRGAMVADKVVGKGAAALMIEGGVAKLHTDVVSLQALNLLNQSSIDYSYDQQVDHIINRTKTDWCPVEKLCKDVATASECVPLIGAFVEGMKK